MEEGNIDRDRIVDEHLIPDEYFCPLCQCLLWKPVSCGTCQHLFCEKCLQTWLATPSSEKHENVECEYLTERCSECDKLVLVSELDEHHEIPGLCIPHPVKCIICQTYIEKLFFKDHFHRCFQKKMEVPVETTFRPDNPQRTTNGEQVTSLNWQAAIFNWLNAVNLLEQQRQLVQIPTNLIGVDVVRQARERQCGFFYHTLLMLTFILANGSKAAFFILSFSFSGLFNFTTVILLSYTFFVIRMGARIYGVCFLIMLFSYILTYGIRFIFRSTSDSLIIYLFGLSIFLRGLSIRVPLELFEMNPLIHMTKTNVGLYCGALLIMKILLLLGRFYYWCIPTYVTVGIVAWLTFGIAFHIVRPSRNTTPSPILQPTTTT